MRNPFQVAGWFWRPIMTRIGIVGITLPWGQVKLLKPWFRVPWLRRHELVHLRQIGRDGPVYFLARYFWFLARYGYRQNPYEIEAYAIASPPEKYDMGGYSTPALPETVKMPAPGDQASLEANRQAQSQLIGLSGRESTNLTGQNQNGTYISDVVGKPAQNQPAGSVSYSGSALGK